MHRVILSAAFAVALFASFAVQAQQPPPAIVSNVKVLSDKVKDVSSLEAWKKSYIREGMSDQDKALAVWESVVAHQFQDSPPSEFLNNEGTVYDALKMFNVYGHSYCGVAACEIASLARYAGLKVRVSTIVAHVVPEVEWDGKWHLLDASLINFFVLKDQPADAVIGKYSKTLTNYPVPHGTIASIEDVQAAVKEFFKDHPDLKKQNAKLMQFQAQGGWTGWAQGPKLLADCPFYDGGGWWPAHTHGWYSTLQEYDGSVYFPYEAGYSMGYKVNVQLRPGEKLIRNWSNKGLFVNMDGTGGAPGSLQAKIGEGPWSYCPKFGDVAPGRIGNGELVYNVPLDASLERNAWRFENLVIDGKALRAKDPANQGILEIRNPCSYVYLKGELKLNATVGSPESVRVFFSDNNGLDWTEAGAVDKTGETTIDLSKLILRRYDYRVRILLKGAGASISGISFRHDVQHSQRPLPALTQGKNTIDFSVGEQTGTVTVEGSCDPSSKGKQILFTDFHPEMTNMKDGKIFIDPAKKDGEISFTVNTPGDMTKLSIMTHYRARDKRAGWDVQVWYDGGKTFKSVATCPGGVAAFGVFTEVTDIPAGTRSAIVKWSGTTFWNATMIFNERIDADYKLANAGFRPVKVTYLWEEGGIEKKDEHIAQSPKETYAINCESKPVMKSLVLEWRNSMRKARQPVIRKATAADLDRVADLWVELIDLHHALDRRHWTPAGRGREITREWMGKSVGAKDRLLLVAEATEGVVGFLHATIEGGPPPMQPRRDGFVTDLMVSPAFRRSGVGHRLARAADDWFRRRGAGAVRLSTAVRNAGAVAFWKKMGFEPWTYGMWKPLKKRKRRTS